MSQNSHSLENFRQALARNPDDAAAHYNLALALGKAGKADEAAAHYEHAIAIDPSHAQAHNNLGNLRAARGQLDEGISHFRQALASKPDYAEAANNLGNALAERGDLDEARTAFDQALAIRPEFPEAYCNLSALKKYSPDDPHLRLLEDMARKARSFPNETQTHLWFAVGKAREDAGRYDDAFVAYEKGNRLKRATIEYDVNRLQQTVDDILNMYDRAFARTQAGWGWGYRDRTPVFIVGMPRSGTTLVEQILASHSKVAGAGEVPYLPQVVTTALGTPLGGSYMNRLAAAGKRELRAMGQAYVRKLRAHNRTAARITDKLPSNYLYAGLIAKILPRSRIIHVVRDPLDTCFSNYALLFKSNVPFAYDLEELGRHYRLYSRLMDRWKEVLPPDRFMEVRYEDLVSTPEKTARAMIKFCGLRWEQSCLEFHRTARRINTASLAQVRQPVYRTSVSRASHFNCHLEKLIAALNEEKHQQ